MAVQLDIGVLVADHISQDEDAELGGLGFRVREVGGCYGGVSNSKKSGNLFTSSRLVLARLISLVSIDVLFPINLISPTGMPSCLKPVVQHSAGAPEVIWDSGLLYFSEYPVSQNQSRLVSRSAIEEES
jgi:hypothetical protein